MLAEEVKEHLEQKIIPFWLALRDQEYGGYYGYVSFDGGIKKEAEKGCILNSRIVWFFANAYLLLGDETLLSAARHGYQFLKKHCLDQEEGGLFWSVTHQGKPADTSKHTYNMAFAVYALSVYYEASKDPESLALAWDLYHVLETKCCDSGGYLESFDRQFVRTENEKLSENGILAERTMNTLLHVFEAYTEFYRITKDTSVKKRLEWQLDTMAEKVYNPSLNRLEVFFDQSWLSLLDLHSYGHDIEAAWLIDRGVEVLGEESYRDKMEPITRTLTKQVYETAFDGSSLSNECECGVDDTNRVWWVQAEGLVGFLNGYQQDPAQTQYRQAAEQLWLYIKEHMMDRRAGSEWYWLLNKDGCPYPDKPLVEPWKCPYHNGRMCMEVIRRATDVT